MVLESYPVKKVTSCHFSVVERERVESGMERERIGCRNMPCIFVIVSWLKVRQEGVELLRCVVCCSIVGWWYELMDVWMKILGPCQGPDIFVTKEVKCCFFVDFWISLRLVAGYLCRDGDSLLDGHRCCPVSGSSMTRYRILYSPPK